MSELFQGLFVVFLVIDLGRFLVLNFIIDEWKNLRFVKWVITAILAILFVYSAVGIYNKLNSMIPDSIQIAMVEAANYNKAKDNAEIKYNRSENLADIAQQEYKAALEWNTTDYNNCIERAEKAKDVSAAQNRCNNTKRRLDKQASDNLKEALAAADKNLDNVHAATTENTKNQSEIAGILTTVCKLMPGSDCKTYDGLQNALTVIILLTICGLDYLQLGIVLAVNTRKNKENDTPDDDPEPDSQPSKLVISTSEIKSKKQVEIPKKSVKKNKKIKKVQKKITPKNKSMVSAFDAAYRHISDKKIAKKTNNFTADTGFYK